MSKNRYVNTHFWDDGFIVYLDPLEKYLFLYFLTNPLTNIAGAYEITLKRIATDTGLDGEMVLKIIERFSQKGKVFYKDGWLYIPNFIKNQSLNENMWKGIEEIAKSLPEWILTNLSERFERLSKALNYLNSNRDSNRDSNREREEARNAPHTPTREFNLIEKNEFLDLYQIYFPKFNLPIPLQETIIGRVTNAAVWKQVLIFWSTNDYRPNSVGKMCDYYDELKNGVKQNGSKKATTNAGYIENSETSDDFLRSIGARPAGRDL